MTVQSIMTTSPPTLRDDDTVGKAIDLLLDERHIMLAVIDANGRYLGEFDIWDLLRMLLPRVATLDDLVPDLRFIADDLPALQARCTGYRDVPVGSVAKTNLPHLDPEMSVLEALLQFYRHRSTLPVIDRESGKLLGVLSYWDALAAVAGKK